MPAAARSRLCSRVSAWAGAFARNVRFFLESHGKQFNGRKSKQINPLTAQRNA